MTPAEERYAELKGRVLAFRTMDSGTRLCRDLVRSGVDPGALGAFLAGPRGRKRPGSVRPASSAALVRRLIESGGHVAGGAALRAWTGSGEAADVDVFFSSFPSWASATLAAYGDPRVDVCLFLEDPCEGFDLGAPMVSVGTSGFRPSARAIEARDTGVCTVLLDNVIHPVSTLGRIAKYASRGYRFRRAEVDELVDRHSLRGSPDLPAATAASS